MENMSILLTETEAKLYKVDEKSAQRRRKHCVLAVVRRSQKFFTPTQTPFPGVEDGQNLFSWRRSLPLPTDPVSWGSMHNFELSW